MGMPGFDLNFGKPGSQVRANRIRLTVVGGLLACLALALGAISGSNSNAVPPYEETASVAALADGLSDHELAGQRIVVGFSGTSVPSSITRSIKSGRIGGIILFSENLPSRAVARSITRRLQRIKRPTALRPYPLPIMIDQEGGLVKRLAGAPNYSAAEIGARGASFARTQGKLTGRNLAGAGINIDLAPVLDVARPGGTIAADRRGFGKTAKRVSKTAIPFARGLQAKGVAATAKHFPGLGSVRINTDDAVQKVGLSKATLRRIDEAPYLRFTKAGGELVMVGSAIYTAFGNRPAAFEKKIVTGELRGRIGYEGVTITDALETVAVRAFGNSKKVSVAGARAGMDLLLFTHLGEALKGEDALAKRLRSGVLNRKEFGESVGRILQMRDRLPD